MASLADLFAIAAKADAVAKPMRVYAQNAKAFALMAEALEQPRSELPPFITSPGQMSRPVVYVRVMVCRAGTRRHVSYLRGRRGHR